MFSNAFSEAAHSSFLIDWHWSKKYIHRGRNKNSNWTSISFLHFSRSTNFELVQNIVSINVCSSWTLKTRAWSMNTWRRKKQSFKLSIIRFVAFPLLSSVTRISSIDWRLVMKMNKLGSFEVILGWKLFVELRILLSVLVEKQREINWRISNGNETLFRRFNHINALIQGDVNCSRFRSDFLVLCQH